MRGRGLLGPALLAILLIAFAARPSAAQDSDALARFRKAFDFPGSADDRVAAAEGLAAVKGRNGPELVCKALAASLDRSAALADERSRNRAELAILGAKIEANGNIRTPEEATRVNRLREVDQRDLALAAATEHNHA